MRNEIYEATPEENYKHWQDMSDAELRSLAPQEVTYPSSPIADITDSSSPSELTLALAKRYISSLIPSLAPLHSSIESILPRLLTYELSPEGELSLQIAPSANTLSQEELQQVLSLLSPRGAK